MPPYCSYDHKIHIDDPRRAAVLRYSLLCNYSTYELQVIKCFLEENLKSSLIVPSQAPFASLVLFIVKLQRDL